MKKTAQNFLIMLKNLQQEQLIKLLRKEIQEIAEGVSNLIGDKITQVSKSSPQNIQKP